MLILCVRVSVCVPSTKERDYLDPIDLLSFLQRGQNPNVLHAHTHAHTIYKNTLIEMEREIHKVDSVDQFIDHKQFNWCK